MLIVIPFVSGAVPGTRGAPQRRSAGAGLPHGARAVAVYVTVSDRRHARSGSHAGRFRGRRQRQAAGDHAVRQRHPADHVVMMLDRSGSMSSNFSSRPSGGGAVRRAAAAWRQGPHRQLCQPHPDRSARIHQQPARLHGDSPHRAAGTRADAALERRQRRHHGAASPAGAPRRPGVHRRHRSADGQQQHQPTTTS